MIFQRPTTEEMESQAALKILLLDDEEMLADMIRSFFEDYGHEVVVVSNGQDAIKKFDEAFESGRRFSLAILDLVVPGGIGGADVVKHIRRKDKSIQAYASSGLPTDPVMLNYESYGFNGSLAKPYSLDLLEDILNAKS